MLIYFKTQVNVFFLRLPCYLFKFACLTDSFEPYMNLRELKIGYVPYLPDLSQPGDRRRFPYFARRNNIEFEIADPGKTYDIILLTAPSNLTQWRKYKRDHPSTKFFFEMVDSLVFPSDLFNTLFKGLGRYIIKKEDQLIFHYKRILDWWIATADVVICSNETLRQYVLKKNPNAVFSPDYLESEYSVRKQNFEISGKMKLVWEGQASVLNHFLSFRKVLQEVSDFCELHVITTEEYPVIPKLYFRNVNEFLKRLPISTVFHKWDIHTHNKILTEADCGVIPIERKNQFGWNKPANKLVSYWFSGLPAVVSDTPAYVRLMKQAGNSNYCATNEEWVATLKNLFAMESSQREAASNRTFNFVKSSFNDNALDLIWSELFNTYGFKRTFL